MKLLITLIGLVLVLESLPYVTFPEAMQKWLQQVVQMPPRQLRAMGLVALVIGLFLCFITQRTALFG